MHRLLMFDLDGTLIDTVDDLTAAVNVVLAARQLIEASRAEVRGMIGNGAHALLSGIFTARAVVLVDAALDDFLRYYTAHLAVMSRPFPGAVATLAAMATHGWRFAICTNKPESAARALLDGLGLSNWFAAVGGGDSFPSRKPDPAHLLATVHAAGGAVGNTVMIGDHANDVRAATAAGVPCIFANWGYGAPGMAAGAARVAQHFDQVEALCEDIIQGQS